MLTTLERAQSLLGLREISEEEKDILQFQIEAASEQIEKSCQRSFGFQTYEEKVHSPGSFVLYLKQAPLKRVLSVYGRKEEREITDYDLDGNGTLYRSLGWKSGKDVYLVRYEAGYILPGDGQRVATLPKSIEMACIYLIKFWRTQSIGVKSEKIGDIAVTYEEAIVDLPLGVRALLSPYMGGWI